MRAFLVRIGCMEKNPHDAYVYDEVHAHEAHVRVPPYIHMSLITEGQRDVCIHMSLIAHVPQHVLITRPSSRPHHTCLSSRPSPHTSLIMSLTTHVPHRRASLYPSVMRYMCTP
jgi:hypothetical protein